MVTKRVDLNTDELAELQLTPAEYKQIQSRFQTKMVAAIRADALPAIRREIPKRSGKLRRSLRLKNNRGRGIINIHFAEGAFYWHMVDANTGGPLPAKIDEIVLEVVRNRGRELLNEAISEVY